AVRAPGEKRTVLTRIRDGPSPFAITSNQTSPVNRSAGPVADGCFGSIANSSPLSRTAVPPAARFHAPGLSQVEGTPPAPEPCPALCLAEAFVRRQRRPVARE